MWSHGDADPTVCDSSPIYAANYEYLGTLDGIGAVRLRSDGPAQPASATRVVGAPSRPRNAVGCMPSICRNALLARQAVMWEPPSMVLLGPNQQEARFRLGAAMGSMADHNGLAETCATCRPLVKPCSTSRPLAKICLTSRHTCGKRSPEGLTAAPFKIIGLREFYFASVSQFNAAPCGSRRPGARTGR